MLTKILIGGAVGASILGIAAASASALPEAAPNGGVVQQSDTLNATCTSLAGAKIPSSAAQFATVAKGTDLVAMRLFQQDFKNCGGAFAQVVATTTNGDPVYSDKVQLNGGGSDYYLTFPANTAVQSIKSVQLTVAGQINNPGATVVNYDPNYHSLVNVAP